MAKRKFVFSKELQRVVEVTDDEVKSLCDEITESLEPFKGDWHDRESNVYGMSNLWPRTSEAMGICPKDIRRAQKMLAEQGVFTEYTPTGEPILRDKKHEREHMKALGFYHRNAGYSDVAPEHFTMDHHPDRQRRELEEWVRRFAG